ncbi:putative transposase for insertion sequence element [Microlunatus phosphovorus NM-1]|nr:putative transposase for insertion sequence element [Microlunatus phosphovorus NM-1]
MKACHTVRPVFDDPNLVGCAGLVPALLLGESAGLHELLGEHVSVDCPNPVVKSAGVIAGMLTGADSIDDLNVVRHGGMPRLLGGTRAPSTYGTYLRSFTHGHV